MLWLQKEQTLLDRELDGLDERQNAMEKALQACTSHDV
jgi:hypothetical protein